MLYGGFERSQPGDDVVEVGNYRGDSPGGEVVEKVQEVAVGPGSGVGLLRRLRQVVGVQAGEELVYAPVVSGTILLEQLTAGGRDDREGLLLRGFARSHGNPGA